MHVLAFPEFIIDKELVPVRDMGVHMVGGTLLFLSQQHSQEIPMLTEHIPSADQSLGLNNVHVGSPRTSQP